MTCLKEGILVVIELLISLTYYGYLLLVMVRRVYEGNLMLLNAAIVLKHLPAYPLHCIIGLFLSGSIHILAKVNPLGFDC
jgi:hypothetical protein